jgi:GTP-binding protein HflX
MRSPYLDGEKLEAVKEQGHFLLIGVVTPAQTRSVTEEHLQELTALVATLGVVQTEAMVIAQRNINPATFIGKGKVSELQQHIQAKAIAGVIFDDDLSPTQLRNLQQTLEVPVRDRTAVILEIFALHARTREAKTQIELATLQYLLPRLSHRWGHLERQVGGINVRAGAGETQIELDRRVIKRRIAKLQQELIAIDHERRVQSQARQNFFRIVLVGYTNVGKSTILNLLTNAQVFVADQLFATLDSTVRQWKLNGYPQVLLSDTIGFIRKLPPSLIASFRSTLAEIKEADLFITVADASEASCFRQLAAVEEILQSIGADEKQQVLVFNKIDRANRATLRQAQRTYPEAVFISALKQLKIEELRQAIVKKIEALQQTYVFRVPAQDGNAIALVYEYTNVRAADYLEAEIQFTVRCFPRIWHWLAPKLQGIRQEPDRPLATRINIQ